MDSDEEEKFFDAMKLANMIAKEQSNNALVMALVGRISKAIENDEGTEKIKQLMDLKKELED